MYRNSQIGLVNRSFRKRRNRPHILLLLVLISLIAALVVLNGPFRSRTTTAKNKPKPDRKSVHPLPALYTGPFQARLSREDTVRRIRLKIKKNETLSSVLTGRGLNPHQVFELTRASARVLDLNKLLPGTEITLCLDKKNGKLVRFEVSQDLGRQAVVLNTPAGYVAAVQRFDPVVCLEAVEGKIKLSLWGTAVEEQNIDPEVILKFSDIFAYDIDFFNDVQAGDSFSILYEKKFLNGQFFRTGKILAAKFVNNGRTLEAYYYQNSKGKGGYYDSKGRSLRKMFLKSPLRYRRISSYFSKSRFHPILKIYRPHLGIDYAAPMGTPVETVGDGRVIFMGWNGGYGKFVKIRHNRVYTTTYGHLSRYAKGLKKGKKVRQGDLIGYVGVTGLATGPHLDFRMIKNNKFINPLSLKLEPAPPIAPAERGRFFSQVEKIRAETSKLLTARR